jgi:hypothetical protein
MLLVTRFNGDEFSSDVGDGRFGSCVDGSGLARTFFTFAALVGAAMCPAF